MELLKELLFLNKKEEKVKAYLQTNSTENKTPKLKALEKTKNLIVIQVEALQSFWYK